jgi:Na+-transporting methylmalonyl-CoA/oxaloacetate decarboxylase gamma subunit
MRLYLIIGVLIAVGLFGAYEHHAGYKERDAEMQAEIAAKNEEARAKEQELNKQLNENATKLQEANHAIDEKQSALDRAIRAGRVRLPATGCVQAGANPTPAAGGGDQAGSESDRETLAAIAAIVAEGQRNTEQLNACIDAYNAARSQVNGQR